MFEVSALSSINRQQIQFCFAHSDKQQTKTWSRFMGSRFNCLKFSRYISCKAQHLTEEYKLHITTIKINEDQTFQAANRFLISFLFTYTLQLIYTFVRLLICFIPSNKPKIRLNFEICMLSVYKINQLNK